MHWFRAKSKVGARLAIFALTVQIAVSFGHVHPGDFRQAVGGFVAARTQFISSAPTQQPISNADDYCAICATIQLVGTSLPPQAPHFQVPFAVRPAEHFYAAAAISFSPQRAPFQSRAPPLA